MNRQLLIYSGIGAGFLVVLVLYSLFAYGPLAKKLEKKKQILSAMQKTYDEELALLARSDEFNERASKLRMEKERLNEQLPESAMMPALLKSITLAATAGRLKHIKFTPLPLVKKEGYIQQRIQLSTTCRYHALGEFISKLAQMPRLINVHVVEIKGNDKTGQTDTIKATLMLVIYVKQK